MGDGYENSGFYQLTYRQVMYILKYKNLNSQAALGQGYVGGSAKQNTGATNANGMDYGDTSSATSRVKLFGLEDFWGNVHEWIDGVITDSSYNILVGTDNFNNSGTGYTSYSSGITSNTSGYMKAPQGTSETGFVLKTNGGSSTTYFADYAYLYASRVAYFGGSWASGSNTGAFRLNLDYSTSNSYSDIGARLMYL
jgi:formylglycine-generating enzyme required for sulfatase activity